MEMAALGGMLVMFLVFAVVGLLVAAFILKLSVRFVGGFSPGYLRSLGAVVVAAILGFIVNLVLTMVFGIGGGMMGAGDPEAAAAAMAGTGMAVMGLGFLVGFFINAFCVNWIIKRPDGSAIGFGRSLLVVLVYMIILVVLAVIASVVIGMLGLGAAGLAGGM